MNTIEEAIFHAASELHDPQVRAAFLDRTCGAQGPLRARLEALLQADLRAGQFLAQDPLELGAKAGNRPGPASAPPYEPPGTVIGRYKLLEKIGEGGMGVVYMAQQEDPVRRRVALKIIKLGMDTEQVVARFEAERQALALMDHPNIAKVLDGGATDTGRPYFVMELVQGVPITEFCDKNRLPAPERIKLFILVCQAIQSAHQKGIIHRDLKPTNILVTLDAGVPIPMVIDFGVAKATNQKLTEKTVFTNYAAMIGTPAYMSPEQAEMSRLDVDTRSDIYGLGVLLYELLTGTTPFTEQRLRSASYNEMQRIILEEEPERPSTRLSTLQGEQRSAVARNRGGSELTLGRAFPGDLDWIVMKCLEKDRARRYETANGLARDLQRHLDNEPVVARPPSKVYRLEKAWRRNKLAFAAAAAVAAALVVGTALATWQAVRASRERDAKGLALRRAVAAERGQARLKDQAQAFGQRAEAEAYASDMLLAQQALAADNFGRARELLYRHRHRDKSERDLRGWEWRYLWQQCTSDALAKVWQTTGKVTDLAVSHDGKWLAIGENSDLTTISVLEFLDRTTTRLVATIPAHRGTVVKLAFSPKGPLLAFSSSEKGMTKTAQWIVHLWNVETQQTLFELPIGYFCGGLSFSADGSMLLVPVVNQPGSSEGELLLLRVPEGTPRARFEVSIPDAETESSPAVSDRDFKVAAIAGDRLRLIDLRTGMPRWSAGNEGGEFGSLVFVKHGTVLITAEGLTDSLFRAWDVGSGNPLGRPVALHHGLVNGFAVWPDDKTVALASADGTIQLWDVSDPAQLHLLGRPLRGQFSRVTALALSSDGKTLFSGGADGSVLAWDTMAARPDQPALVLPEVFDWQFAPDNGSLLTIDPQGRVTRLEGAGFQVRKPVLALGAELAYVRDRTEFSDDGELLATARDGVVRVWDLRSNVPSPRLVTAGRLGARSLARGAKLLMLYDGATAAVREWDLNTFQEMRSWPGILPWRGVPLLALSPHGKYSLNLSYGGGEALLRDLATGQSSTWTNPVSGGVCDLDFSHNGELFAVATDRGSTRVWERESRRPVATVGHQQMPVYGVGFSGDASRLITTSDGPDALTLWDLSSGRELLTLQAPGYKFESPRFSPDGSLLGCRNKQNELYVWRAPSWAEIQTAERTKPNSP